MRRTTAAALLLAATWILGCKKSGNDNSEVSFINRLNKEVTLDIYSNFDDYSKGQNVQLRKVLLSDETTYLPGNTFPAGATYYMDWYTDDHLQNNWLNDNYESSPVTRIQPVPGNNSYYLDPKLKGNARKTFLNSTQASSTWIAIGAYLFAGGQYSEQWSNLDANERYRKVTVTKGFKANYEYKDGTGSIQTSSYDFMVHRSEDAYIELKDATGKNIGNITGGKLPSGTPPDYKSPSTDTVMALLPGSDYLFMMVKQ